MHPNPPLSPEDILERIRAALDPVRRDHSELARLARRLSFFVMSADLPDRLDAWRVLLHWLSGPRLWTDVYIDAVDVRLGGGHAFG